MLQYLEIGKDLVAFVKLVIDELPQLQKEAGDVINLAAEIYKKAKEIFDEQQPAQ